MERAWCIQMTINSAQRSEMGPYGRLELVRRDSTAAQSRNGNKASLQKLCKRIVMQKMALATAKYPNGIRKVWSCMEDGVKV